MKKIMILLALVAGMQLANAQKSADAVKKAVESAQAASQDAKKATKVATWMNLAKASMEAYNAPMLNGWAGAGRQELQVLMNGVKVVSTTEEVIGENAYTVDHYKNCDYYFNQAGVLQMIVVTKPYVKNALEIALDAYSKAASVDPKGSKTKDIVAGIQKVADAYQNEAINSYTFGKYEEASDAFAKSAAAAATSPLCKVDSTCLYNSALTAFMAQKWEKAKQGMQKCIDINYLEKGEVFAKLADCEKALGDTTACKAALEKGFAVCPDNQSILVGLINLYLETNDDPEKLFTLLDKAKENEPGNASLYYVEGNIRKQLGQIDAAVAAYGKCAEVNPSYEFGFIGQGLLYYDEAVKLQEKAQNEFNDRKYMELVEQMDKTLKLAIPAFEKAFETTQQPATKVGVAEYLKNIYFRYRDQDDFQAKYDQFNEYVKANQQ